MLVKALIYNCCLTFVWDIKWINGKDRFMHDSFNELLVSFFRRFMFHQWEHCLPLSQGAKLTIQIQNLQACHTCWKSYFILVFFYTKMWPKFKIPKSKKKHFIKWTLFFFLGMVLMGIKSPFFAANKS